MPAKPGEKTLKGFSRLLSSLAAIAFPTGNPDISVAALTDGNRWLLAGSEREHDLYRRLEFLEQHAAECERVHIIRRRVDELRGIDARADRLPFVQFPVSWIVCRRPMPK